MSVAAAIAATLLTALVHEPRPWLRFEAGSEQRRPLYLGLTPLELSLGARPRSASPVLPAGLKALAEKQIRSFRPAIPAKTFTVEAWPTIDDLGQLSWTFARWRETAGGAWAWLDAAALPSSPHEGPAEPEPFLPHVLRPADAADHAALFADFATVPDLYTKPVFGDCVWTDRSGAKVRAGWLAPDEREAFARRLDRDARLGGDTVCRLLPQPARYDGRPFSVVIAVTGDRIEWPKRLRWAEPEAPSPPAAPGRAISAWPDDFAAALKADVLALSAEAEVVYPSSQRRARFTRKNSADPGHQLEALADYLAERYVKLGIRTERERFLWRGVAQSNLIAIIPGTNRGAANRPVVLADHYDTAFCEDIFRKTGARVSAPGADDNVSGTATLLRAAEVLKGTRPRMDILLVHMTGEELPGDDLGARHFVDGLLRRGQRLTGVVVVDMIGNHPAKSGVFQINPGSRPESVRLGALAMALAPELVESWMRPTLRPRYDPKSYLYNTDGLIFEEAGYPILLINEHINRWENYGQPGNHRPGYHQSDDVAAGIDFAYATGIAKVAIEVVAELAR
jgi:hypothetical protein